MTTLAEDSIAGVSLRPPLPQYTAEVPDTGVVTLRRGPELALVGIALELSPAAVARAVAAGGTDVSAVTFSLPARRRTPAWFDDARASALRGLLVERRLLAHPEWLGDAAPPPELTDDERWFVESLRDELRDGTQQLRRARECDPCTARRLGAMRSELAKLEEVAFTRRQDGHPLNQRQIVDVYQRLMTLRTSLYRETLEECPHAEFADRAQLALAAAHGELAFELVNLITPHNHRFILTESSFAVALSPWLSGRSHHAPSVYGSRARRTLSWSRIRDRAAASELPAEQSEAVTYAAAAWGATAPLNALGWTPTSEVPVPSTLRDDDTRLDVSAQVPSFALKRPPPRPAEVAAKPAKPAKPAAKPAKPAKPAEVAAKPAKPAKPAEVAAKPAKPAKPAEVAAKPAKPAKPAEVAAKPAKPAEVAAKPAKPAKPAAKVRGVTREVLRAVGLSDVLIDEMVEEGRLIALDDGHYAHPAELKRPRR